jgi:N-methylhydantoinase A/oxoprolinase/acetone carboxylase beta subunit
MSSIGLLTAPLAFERSRAVNSLLDAADPAGIESVFSELERAAAAMLPAGGELIVERSVELRYSGQDYALEIPVANTTTGGARAKWAADFLAAYEAQYGTVDNENPIELAAVRILVKRPLPPRDIVGVHRRSSADPKGTRKVFVANLASIVEVPIYERSALGTGQTINGPAVIEERESTTVVGSGDQVRVDEHACLVVTVSLPPMARLEADAMSAEKAEA